MKLIKNGEEAYDLQAMLDREAKRLKPEQIGLASITIEAHSSHARRDSKDH